MQLIDNTIPTLLKAHSSQIALVSGAAEVALQLFTGSGLPWWAIAGLFGLVLIGRAIKQPSISGGEADDAS